MAAAASVQERPFLNSLLIKRQAASFCITSNKPSQARRRYLSSEEILCSLTSGSGITKNKPSDLKSQSPIARETAKPPITRLWITKPPAFRIRSCSSGRSGLWSEDMARHSSLVLRTHRESPAFATQSLPVLCCTNAQTAVVPDRPLSDENLEIERDS